MLFEINKDTFVPKTHLVYILILWRIIEAYFHTECTVPVSMPPNQLIQLLQNEKVNSNKNEQYFAFSDDYFNTKLTVSEALLRMGYTILY